MSNKPDDKAPEKEAPVHYLGEVRMSLTTSQPTKEEQEKKTNV
jgi:hypothetical protein